MQIKTLHKNMYRFYAWARTSLPLRIFATASFRLKMQLRRLTCSRIWASTSVQIQSPQAARRVRPTSLVHFKVLGFNLRFCWSSTLALIHTFTRGGDKFFQLRCVDKTWNKRITDDK